MKDHHTLQAGTDNPEEVPPGTPSSGENVCRHCGGTGKLGAETCEECDGTGIVITPVGGAG